METRYLPDSVRYPHLTPGELRASYLVENLFQPGSVRLVYTDLDRAVIGGAVPTTQKLTLETSKELAASFFAERREVGVINLGGKGAIVVDGKEFVLAKRDRSAFAGRIAHRDRRLTGCRSSKFKTAVNLVHANVDEFVTLRAPSFNRVQ